MSTLINTKARQPVKVLTMIAISIFMLSLDSDSSRNTYLIPDTTIYESISPPYILYVKDAPGVCQYWFYDIDGTAQPLLKHELENKQYRSLSIYERPYKWAGR
jgi:hypothetical protein